MAIVESKSVSPPPIETPLADPAIRHWTREEYYRLGDEGFFQDERVQLIHGEILKMSPMKSRHAAAIELARRALQKAYGEAMWIRDQLPLYLSDDTEPEPDLAVVRGAPRDHSDEHPRTALLVVEVSESTLRFDRTIKRALYASAGVTEYWIINLIDRRLELFRGAQEGDYTHAETLSAVDRLTPPQAQQAVLVADLLP